MAKAGKCSAEAQTPFKTTIFGRVLRLHPKSESWLKGLIAQVRPTVSPQLGPRTGKAGFARLLGLLDQGCT